LAQKWKTEEPKKYLGLHVRKCSKNQYGISFLYVAEGFAQKKFFHKITDQLKRQFGNDFVGYDISEHVWMVE
jgi:hypothetical protein